MTGIGWAMVLAAVLAAGDVPERFDLVIEAETFARGSVKAVVDSGWADAGGIVQCNEQSPDWAEWDFEVGEDGVYQLHGKLAANASRAVEVLVDGHYVNRAGLKETTGSWKSSTARWFRIGLAPLKAGTHVLRIWRSTCIPHIDAFGLMRIAELDMSKGILELPETIWLEDSYPIQDWMIWTLGGTEQFEVKDGAYRIVNGQHTLNRPLYGTNGMETVFAGDRPVVVFTRGPSTKLGALGAEIVAEGQRNWLDEAERIAFAYDGAHVTWTINDPLLGDGTLVLEASALKDAPGYIVRTTADKPLRLSWWYGGVREGYPDNKAGHGALPGGRSEADCDGNTVEVTDGVARLAHSDVGGAEVFVTLRPEAGLEADGTVLRAEVNVGAEPAYVVVAATHEAVSAAVADPAATWRAAREHYEGIASRLTVKIPYPVLDAAMRGNNAAMDGQYRPPSFLHGALRWGTECDGWYLGWRGWYGPIVAGDFERVKAAARMHFEHQYAEPAEGLHSAGKVAPFVHFDGREKRGGYNMHEVFLDHLRSYYWWTGDHPLMKELWPNIKSALEYQRREIGKNLDGLYTNAVNTWISDGHHYNGHACTQASAYAVAHNRWAAQVAKLAGGDAKFYEEQAARTLGEINARLWMPEKGYYAEYVDGDGVWHDAAEAATIYHAAEMGAADAFQVYQITRYVDERLWRFGDQILANDWFPVIVTCGLIGFNESLNTALAYYYAGRFERAWRLLKVCCDSTAKATVPGSISCYGSREGEQGVYVDFTDASSMFARTVVEGLFGVQPRVDEGRVEWSPRFPSAWDRAALRTRGFAVRFEREGETATYVLESEAELDHVLILPAAFDEFEARTPPGVPAKFDMVDAVLRPYVRVTSPKARETVVEVKGTGDLPSLDHPARCAKGATLVVNCNGAQIRDVRDPQGLFAAWDIASDGTLTATLAKDDGHHTAFARVIGGAAPFWAPINVEAVPPFAIENARVAAAPGVEGVGLVFTLVNNTYEAYQGDARITFAGLELDAGLDVPAGEAQTVRLPLDRMAGVTPGHMTVRVRGDGLDLTGRARLWCVFDALSGRRAAFRGECALIPFERNDTLAEIFTREYDADNPPELNNWTWYKTDYINTSAMRKRAKDGVLMTHVGVPFAVTMEGNDGLYVSRWDLFPQAARVAVGVRGDKLYLLLANHTHNSQTHLTQAEVVLEYADGDEQTVPLTGPADIDGMLQHYSDMAPEWIGGRDGGWYGHGRASGVHADVTDIELDPSRELAGFEIRCVTEETLIGLLGATVHRPAD